MSESKVLPERMMPMSREDYAKLHLELIALAHRLSTLDVEKFLSVTTRAEEILDGKEKFKNMSTTSLPALSDFARSLVRAKMSAAKFKEAMLPMEQAVKNEISKSKS